MAATHDDITLFNTNGYYEAPTFTASSVNALACIGVGANDAFAVQGPLVFNLTLQAGGPGAVASITGDGTSTMVLDPYLDGQIIQISGDGLGSLVGNLLFLDGMADADLDAGGAAVDHRWHCRPGQL